MNKQDLLDEFDEKFPELFVVQNKSAEYSELDNVEKEVKDFFSQSLDRYAAAEREVREKMIEGITSIKKEYNLNRTLYDDGWNDALQDAIQSLSKDTK